MHLMISIKKDHQYLKANQYVLYHISITCWQLYHLNPNKKIRLHIFLKFLVCRGVFNNERTSLKKLHNVCSCKIFNNALHALWRILYFTLHVAITFLNASPLLSSSTFGLCDLLSLHFFVLFLY